MRKKTITLILLSLITLGLLGLLLWLRYDHSLDRSGWAQREGRTVYLDASGDPVRGWMELEGDRYYFDETGAMGVGWQDGCFLAGSGWKKVLF